MKKIIISFICVLLCLTIIFPTVAFAYDGNLCKEMPTVYLCGQGTEISKVAGDVNSGILFPFDYDTDFIMSKAPSLLVSYTKGVLTDDWDSYIDAICDTVIPIVSTAKCDKNGDVVDGSGVTNQNVGNVLNISKNEPKITRVDGTSVLAYSFRYDWRLDPCELADQLDGYIKKVKEKTGSDKVNICVRCLGVDILLAYLDKYGVKDLNKSIMYSGGFDGIDTIGQIFSCKLALDGDTIEAFTNGYFSLDENVGNPVSELIKCCISLYNKSGALDVSAVPVQVVYDKIYEKLMPRLFWNLLQQCRDFGVMLEKNIIKKRKM